MAQTSPPADGESHSSAPEPHTIGPDDTPAAVREYTRGILCEEFGIPPSKAGRIASKWQFGSSAALQLHDVDTFKTMFGNEIGSLLFHRVKGTLPPGKWDAGAIDTAPRDLFGLRYGGN